MTILRAIEGIVYLGFRYNIIFTTILSIGGDSKATGDNAVVLHAFLSKFIDNADSTFDDLLFFRLDDFYGYVQEFPQFSQPTSDCAW